MTPTMRDVMNILGGRPLPIDGCQVAAWSLLETSPATWRRTRLDCEVARGVVADLLVDTTAVWICADPASMLDAKKVRRWANRILAADQVDGLVVIALDQIPLPAALKGKPIAVLQLH